jgi:hypothetical protein
MNKAIDQFTPLPSTHFTCLRKIAAFSNSLAQKPQSGIYFKKKKKKKKYQIGEMNK